MTIEKKNRQHKKLKINVIVPFRDVENYIFACCQSILSQNYFNYRVFFIDDCSSDNSINKIPKDNRFIIIANSNRKYTLNNIINVLCDYSFNNDDLIVILDGDDALSSNFVFSLINDIYNIKNCMITYGSFRIMNTNRKSSGRYSKKEFSELRKTIWKASHLKTFKYSLFSQYRKLDPEFHHMKDNTGKYYKMTSDIALMFPLLELAGYSYTFFINEPIYLYRLHDKNDHIVNRVLQYTIEMEIRNKTGFAKKL